MPVSIKPAEVAPHTPSQRAASELPTASPTSSGSEDASDAAALAQTWADMVVHMGLKAFAGQLARQSELVLLTETAMVLRCEKLSLATDDNALSGLRSALKTLAIASEVLPAKQSTYIYLTHGFFRIGRLR